MQSNGLEIYANSRILSAVESRLKAWKKSNIVSRVWGLDPTVWKKNPEDNVELSNRLGWLSLPSSMQKQVNLLETFALDTIKYFDDIVLLGMGGSSLAPEVFFKTFRKRNGYPDLTVLDSTHPLSVRDKFHTAVTSGYGPRFLHSTGQLHKGDGNKGLFIQLTTDPVNDLEVPGRGYSFGTLITAQAQGDLKALKNNGRKVIRFHLTGNLKGHIDFLTSLIN